MNRHLSSRAFVICMILAGVGLCGLATWLCISYSLDKPWIQRLNMARQRNSRGQIVQLFFDIRVMDAKSGELLWSAEKPPVSALVGEHYLVGCDQGKIVAIDLDDALSAPTIPGSRDKRKDIQFQRFELLIPEITLSLNRQPREMAIPNTNRFLVLLPDSDPRKAATAYAVEIQDRTLKLMAQWTCHNRGLFVLPNGQINSLQPGKGAMEIRSPDDFHVERTVKVPAGFLGADFQVRNDLFSFSDPKTSVAKVGSLQDLAILPGLDIGLCSEAPPEFGSDRRYHVLSDGRLRHSRRLVVYDSEKRAVVYDSGPGLGWKAVQIKEGCLHLTSLLWGYTTEVIDLASGQTVSIARPYRWILLCMPCVLMAALVWLQVWTTRVPVTAWNLPANILFVAALFMTPLIYREGRAGFHIFGYYPGVRFTLSMVLVLYFGLALYAAMGRGRVLLRLVPILLCLSAMLFVFDGLKLIDFTRAAAQRDAVLAFRVWITFGVFSLVMLYVLSYLGLRFDALDRTDVRLAQAEASSKGRARVHLLDLFVLTTSVALAIKMFGPVLDVLIDPQYAWYVVQQAGQYVAAAAFGLLALVRSQRLYKIIAPCVFVVALSAIVDIVVHLAMEKYRLQWWYRAADEARYVIFVGLASFAMCSMIRRVALLGQVKTAG